MKRPEGAKYTTGFYSNGKTLRKGFYLDGYAVGPVVYYHTNGNLEYVGCYINDVVNKNVINRQVGLCKTYDENGVLEEEVIYIK